MSAAARAIANARALNSGEFALGLDANGNFVAAPIATMGKKMVGMRNFGATRPFIGHGSIAGTTNVTVGSAFLLPARPRWIRPIFSNDTASPISYAAVSVACTSQLQSPNQQAAVAYDGTGTAQAGLWQRVGFNGVGSMSVTPLTPLSGSATTITVPGTANSEQPAAPVAGDWINVFAAASPPPAGRIDGGIGYLVIVHAFGGANTPTLFYPLPGEADPAIGVFTGGCYYGGDFASSNQNGLGVTTSDATAMACYGIEAIYENSIKTHTWVGDSVGACAGSINGVSGPGLRLQRALFNAGLNSSYLAQTVSSRTNANFIPDGYADLIAHKPDLPFIQLISGNDLAANPVQATLDAMYARSLALAEAYVAAGIPPVIVLPTPFYTFNLSGNAAGEALRKASCAFGRSLSNSFQILDLDAILSTAPNSGTYNPALAYSDNIHPNDAGCIAMVQGNNGYPGMLSIAQRAYS